MEYTEHQVQWHYYLYWFCECQSWRTGGRMVSNECVGRASMPYIIKHPIENTIDSCDGIHWHQLQWHYYMYWFCECQSCTNWRWMSSNELCGGEQSHAYISSPQLNTWLLVMEYTDIRYSDITTCIDSVSARAHNWGTDGLQMNCVRESSLMLT